ncbi:MAG: hypothetical protein WC001_13895, partial [Desulfurivibrionaceae bacterium]
MKIVVALLLLVVAQPIPPLAGVALGAGSEPNTVMVPPRINAPAGGEQLVVASDKILQEVVRSKGMA